MRNPTSQQLNTPTGGNHKMEMEALLEEFEMYLRADKKPQSTIDTYVPYIREFLPFVGKEPEDIRAKDIEMFKAHLASRLSGSTINVGLAVVKTFLRSHQNYEADRVRRVRQARKLPIPLTEEELNQLLDSAKTDPLTYAITATLYWTGIRNSSLCNLDLDDILWDVHRLALRNAKRGKTYTVFIPDQALETIQAYLPYREKPILAKDHDAVFVNPNTQERIQRDAVNWRVKKAAVKAGIRKRIYAHLLRHTHGTLARTQGLALDTIARQMGHESIATTQLYAQLADEVYEQEYQSFFDGHPVSRVEKRRPEFHPDRDWAYR